jgi:hypothetical protein
VAAAGRILTRRPNHPTEPLLAGALHPLATLSPCALPTLPTMCSTVTRAMKPRLPMMTTCCRGREAQGGGAQQQQSQGVSLALAKPSLAQQQGAGSHVGAWSVPILTGAILMPGESSV